LSFWGDWEILGRGTWKKSGSLAWLLGAFEEILGLLKRFGRTVRGLIRILERWRSNMGRKVDKSEEMRGFSSLGCFEGFDA
jgi:hypothetical protein